MANRERLFIYDRKEMGVLILLGLMVALFAFTLGVHLGKRVGPKVASLSQETYPAVTVPDSVPERSEIAEQAKGFSVKEEDSHFRALQNEVIKTGLKLETLRPLELPKQISMGYTLQVGSYAARAEAKDRVKRLVSAGLTDAFLQEVNLKKKGKRYRVYAGQFESVEAAKKMGAQYRAKNKIDSFIISNKTR